ncbi:translocation/assembly module TamB domain-containing protein [Parabacteroides sp. PF5-6]|uniref:translocation/assembly module TamB domain-containing protein n=1 Tax=Parabacteroides sp. PF5-6 TaxID=1742403 RepID=UPI002406FBD9|nr:translocation/assembly module TamB domain-containing protein [Parabacteroides sp. PF5-6]MDF9830720.1 hypothetical protein [Parabacteroides sp. PF5-6]
MLNIPYVQRQVSQTTSEKLSEYLGVPVQVDKIRIRWINRLVMEGVYLEDQKGKPLLEATHVSAGFKLLPILRGQYVFTTVRLFGFDLHLEKETPQDKLNLQFVIDAFASRDTLKQQPEIDLRLNSVLLRRGNITYHVHSEKLTPDRFNPKHIDIENISANISLKAFNKDSVNANIKKLSFDEHSGFRLDKLSMNLVSNRDSAYIDHFEIRLPTTQLKIDKALMDISRVDGLTTLFNDAPMELDIHSSSIGLKDLSPFIPAFSHFTDRIQLSAKASGTINNINLKQLTVKQDNHLFFDGQMEMKGITTPEDTYVFGKVNRMFVTKEGLHTLANNFSKEPLVLPAPVMRLGTVNFKGEISGFFDNLVAFGELSSDIGSLQTDMIFGRDKEKNIAAYVKGHAATSNLSLVDLFEENNPFGNARFSLTVDAIRPVKGNAKVNVQGEIGEFEYKGYTYENILLSGNFNPNGVDGFIEINDPNGALRAEGILQNEGNNSVFNFTADLQHFRPDRLNLSDRFEEPELSLRLNADFTGNNIDYAQGQIILDSLSFRTRPSDFFLEKMKIEASGHAEERRLTLSSDIVNGEIVGAYSFHTIIPSLIHTFEAYLPTLIKNRKREEKIEENNFSILLTVENTEELSQTFKLPVTIVEQARISGHYNNRYDKFRIEAWLPQFNLQNSTFQSGYLSCENPKDKVNLQLKAINYNKKGLENHLSFQADAGEDLINTLIAWENNKEQEYKAEFSASALFIEDLNEEEKPELRTEISIHESPVVVNDSLWLIDPSSVTIKNQKVNIDNFMVAHNQQFLHLDGTVSPDPTDTLYMNLQQMELSYIFEILNIPVLQFGGQATGAFVVNDLYHSRMLHTDLMVENFSFNKVPLGLLNLYSEWDDSQQGILMLGSIYKNDSTWTDVNGYIFPIKPKEGLSLHFDANDIDISFLQPFLNNVAQNVKGRGFGHVHLFGPFHELTAEGDAYVEEGGLGIEFLNTYYTFSDSIHLDPSQIQIKEVTVYDKFGNTGKVNLDFNHKYFHDYDFTATIQANKILLYDQTEKNSPMIYGTAFGSGSGTIQGNENLINFDISVRSEPGTFAGFNFMTNSASSEYDFITFIDKDRLPEATTPTAPDSIRRRPANTDGAELRMNFQVDITPDATIELIMDPAAGDRIKGNTNGNLQIQYGTRSDLKMYGGLNIVQGNYNFSLQQLIYRDFKIRDGSTVSFQGDPFGATMNIDAIYSVTANIGDLDQHLLQESDRVNVPVNCVLKLDGMLQNPLISFDLELPGSNDEIERQVRSFIDTEDMMIRQVVYLMVLHKFYTPDYATTLYRTNEFSAVASSAISSQLSNMLNTITDKVQIGTNIRTSQDRFDDTEVEMLLSSQLLDNRLIFNGNFGYRNSISLQKNVFVGEFDLEYKLTPGGEVRLKAYNHANDMYQYLKQSLFTQGVGILLKKDFTTLYDLFYRRRRPLVPALPPEPQEAALSD